MKNKLFYLLAVAAVSQLSGCSFDEFSVTGQECQSSGEVPVILCSKDTNGNLTCTKNDKLKAVDGHCPAFAPFCINSKQINENGEAVQNKICTNIQNVDTLETYKECSNDDYKYENNESNVCIKFVCKDGKWEKDEACKNDVSCKIQDGSLACGDCNDQTEAKCENNAENQGTLIKCIGGMIQETRCMDGATPSPCADNKACPTCKEGEQRTFPNDAGICFKQTCTNGVWNINENECGDIVSCIKDDKTNQYQCGECLNNSTKCENSTQYTCDDGKWGHASQCIDDDGNSLKCLNDKTCPVCNNGQTSYRNISVDADDNTSYCHPVKCENSDWVKDDQGKTCDNKVSCTMHDDIEKDDHDEITKVTTKGECGGCLNETIRCVENENIGKLEICKNGNWIDLSACQNAGMETSCEPLNASLTDAQDIHSISCGTCLNGQTKCELQDGIRKEFECREGSWETTIENCTNSCHYIDDKTSKCGDCINQSIVCDDTTIRKCNNGLYVEQTCQDVSCIDAENASEIQCGECKNGEKIARNSDTSICQEYICDNGKYRLTESESFNPSQFSCKKNSSGSASEYTVGNCLNESARCHDESYEICIEGEYKPVPSCSACEEIDGNAQCKNECTSSGSTCLDGMLTICTQEQDGTYSAQIKFCDDMNSCKTEHSCGECKNGEIKCENDETGAHGMVYYCESGQWNPTSTSNPEQETGPCQNGNSCTASNRCGECHNGHQRINPENANGIEICQDGAWAPYITCPDSASPRKDDEHEYSCGECKNGQNECHNYTVYGDTADASKTKLSGQISECVGGELVFLNECSSKGKVSCGNAQECGECLGYFIEKAENHGGKSTDHALATCLDGKLYITKCSFSLDKVGKRETLGDYEACKYRDDDNIMCYMDKNIGYIRSNKQPCTNNASCTITGNAASICGDCQNGQMRCTKDNASLELQETCVNGSWVTTYPARKCQSAAETP